MRILTADEMAAVDRRASEEIGIPNLVLMENAALGLADAVAELFGAARDVVFFCGPGNNGGDGLALARHLDARGYRCRILVMGSPKGDARTQLEILENCGLAIGRVDENADLEALAAAHHAADLWVDALFGTGLTRPLGGAYARLAELIAAAPVPVLAVDLPSGLDGSRPDLPGPHARAAVSVTFAAPKVAHVFPPACDVAGRVVVADLGIPPRLLDEAPGQLHLLTRDELAAYLPARDSASHKGTWGHLLLVGGAPGKAGAVILGARAAVRGGAGLVTAAVPESILPTVEAGAVESMTLALPAPADGGAGDLDDAILAAAAGKDAVALGPGLGTADATAAAVRRAVPRLEPPLVLDADGLNAFAGRAQDLAARRAPTVLTPHPGELARLLGVTTEAIAADRVAMARRAAAATGAVVILKGHQSLVATPEGEVHVNPTGNPGMATGGSGDVLTGLLGAFLAQGWEALAAGQLGVYLHGLAGDLALHPGAPEALAAGDLITALPRAFAELRDG